MPLPIIEVACMTLHSSSDISLAIHCNSTGYLNPTYYDTSTAISRGLDTRVFSD